MKLDRTPLGVNQLTDLESSAYDWFASDLAGSISYKRFKSSTASHSIYEEAKVKEYETAITLKAIITIDPSAEFLEELGVDEKVDAVFIVMQKELDDNGITVGDETTPLTTKDVITYKNQDYDITKVGEYGQTILGENLLVQILGVVSPL